MPLDIAKSGDLDRCYRCLTDWLTDSFTTLEESATQLLINYKSGALVTQLSSVEDWDPSPNYAPDYFPSVAIDLLRTCLFRLHLVPTSTQWTSFPPQTSKHEHSMCWEYKEYLLLRGKSKCGRFKLTFQFHNTSTHLPYCSSMQSI